MIRAFVFNSPYAKAPFSKSQHSRQPAIRKSKDKSDQPDAKDAQPQDHYAALSICLGAVKT